MYENLKKLEKNDVMIVNIYSSFGGFCFMKQTLLGIKREGDVKIHC